MHVFGVVLENDEGGFEEDENPRYIFLYEQLLESIADKLGVRSIFYFDGFKKAAEQANLIADPKKLVEWLKAYNTAKDEIGPEWFDPELALNCLEEVPKELTRIYDENGDDDLEVLIDAIQELISILHGAREKGIKFFMAVM